MGNDDGRKRQLRIWLLVVAPPLLMILLAMSTGLAPLRFLAILWAVGAVAVALGYSSQRKQVEPPSPAGRSGPAPAQPSEAAEISSAIVRVASVKAEYGSLLGDIAYRIENSALFDDAAPLTREFQLALIRWDDVQATADVPTLQRASGEVELAFRTAKSHAETVGLSHLPTTSAQHKAERALKAAHLAERAPSQSEREAALAQVARLLDSIALYYLPSPADVPRMLGGARPELDH